MQLSHSLPTKPVSILLVEDDDDLAGLIQDYLRKNGFQVERIADGLTAYHAILRQHPELVILDINLPGMSGMDVCRQVRSDFNGLILMLTALDEDMDQMLGLELGADDYVVKPVQPRLLLTRIRALLRRLTHVGQRNAESGSTHPEPDFHPARLITAGSLQIDCGKRQARIGDQPVDLTTAEFELLLLLAEHCGQPVSRDVIVQQLRGLDYDGLDRSMDRRVSRLRRKLEQAGAQEPTIITVRGQGYQLCSD